MEIHYTLHFKQNYQSLPEEIRKKFQKQSDYLLQNFQHPSLQAKKYDKERNIWQARVDKKYRFYFLIEKDFYILLNIRKHK